MGNIKCKCQVVRRRSWCQQVRRSPGTFPPTPQCPPSLNPSLVMAIMSPSWHAAQPRTSKRGLQKPRQRKAISPPGGSSGCPGCPLGISSGCCTAGADPPRVKINVAPVVSAQLNRFVPAEYVAVRKGHSHPYLVLPVPELNWLDYSWNKSHR